jgi:hypothetical protein
MVRTGVAFVVVLAALTVAGLLYERDIRDPNVGGTLPTPQLMGPDWYVAVDDDLIHWDHYIHYTGYGPAIANLKAADVVILGNSRSQYSFDPDEIVAYSAEHGTRIYNMGFGHGESLKFAEVVLNQHDVRPRIIVVMVDVGPSSFSNVMSPFAESIVSKGTWGATRYVYSNMLARLVQEPMQRVFPYFHASNPRTILYRSWSHGFWGRQVAAREAPSWDPIETATDFRPADVRRTERAEARAFVRRMRARGSAVVFGWVHTPLSPKRSAADLAEAADVPLIAPDIRGLRTFDGTHLDVESARRYTLAFEEQLTPIVGRILAAGAR